MRVPKFLLGFIGGAITVALMGGGLAYAHGDYRTTVVRVIDGDTLVARVNGDETTIRLLNVDTPETKDPAKPVECMGPQASQYLESRLPPGTTIQLEYDIERTDRYGRTLAGIYESGSLVNADIAAKGLGVAVIFEPNRRFYDQVKRAEMAAQGGEQGVFDPATGCTIPAQWEAVIDQTTSTSETPSTSEAARLAAAALDGRTRTARALLAVLLAKGIGSTVEDVVYRIVHAGYLSRVTTGLATADASIQGLRADHDLLAKAEHDQRVSERKLAAKAKKAAKKAAVRKAAVRAAAAAEVAARRAAQRAAAYKAAHKRSAKYTKKKKSKYNGPRCYAPGGRTWRPC